MSRYLATEAAAAQLGVAAKTLSRWRELEIDGAPVAPCRQPGGPRGPIAWNADELEAWAERLSTWHRRRHLKVVAAKTQPAAPPPGLSLLARGKARAADQLRGKRKLSG